ncbi:MAG: hypothetical protein ACRDA9_04740 [Plesiomonas shigelloides]
MDKTIRVGIITGIIASMIFVYFLDPIIRVFGDGVLYVSEYLVTGLLDSLYQKSALGIAKDPALSTYSILVGIFFAFPVTALTVILRNKILPASDDQEKDRAQSRKFIAIIPLVILPIMLFYQFWTMLFQYQIVTSFDQHMRILAPYMDTRERIIIESNFASMQKEEDYKNLYRKMYELAKENNVVLPDNPTYGFWNF